MTSPIDSARAVRSGEELDLSRLEPYLREQLPQAGAGPLTVEQFPSGYSNLTYLLKLGELELVLRRPPFGNQIKSAHDMGREFRVLSKLSAVFQPAPKPYLYCEDESVLGAPFYVMERRRGIVLRRERDPNLNLDPKTCRRLSESFIDVLAELHGLDYTAAGLGDLGKPEGYVERQVHGWSKRYENARTEDVPSMEQMARWLADHMPKETGAALVHNDYKYDNVLLDPHDMTRIIGVFDWEMATIGDPLMDLGSTLAYWVEAGDPDMLKFFVVGPTADPGSMTRRELVDRYAQKSGRDVSEMLFYYCYGLFKTAVILQQIYARYVRGHTKDQRFSALNLVVAMMSQAAVQASETGKF
jgi:aminoglycoside phosphotransferase (APT) family kinase protein